MYGVVCCVCCPRWCFITCCDSRKTKSTTRCVQTQCKDERCENFRGKMESTRNRLKVNHLGIKWGIFWQCLLCFLLTVFVRYISFICFTSLPWDFSLMCAFSFFGEYYICCELSRLFKDLFTSSAISRNFRENFSLPVKFLTFCWICFLRFFHLFCNFSHVQNFFANFIALLRIS